MPRRNRHSRDGRWGSPRKRPPEWDDEVQERRRPERRHTRPQRGPRPPVTDPVPQPVVLVAEPVARACGSCREWFPDEVGGRGTCDHPGSGFLKPWSDTPACPFFAARR